jgi:hypothetical protein
MCAIYCAWVRVQQKRLRVMQPELHQMQQQHSSKRFLLSISEITLTDKQPQVTLGKGHWPSVVLLVALSAPCESHGPALLSSGAPIPLLSYEDPSFVIEVST